MTGQVYRIVGPDGEPVKLAWASKLKGLHATLTGAKLARHHHGRDAKIQVTSVEWTDVEL